MCTDQPAFVVSTRFMPCFFSYRLLLFEVSVFGKAEEQIHRELSVSLFEHLFNPCSVSCLGPE